MASRTAWRGRRIAATVVAVGVVGVLTASTAEAAPPLRQLVGLGDSYTTGIGIPPSDGSSCGRSTRAYPLAAARALGAAGRSVACGGAVVADLTAPGRSGEPAQVDGLGGADLVALTIGGNDVGGPHGVLDSAASPAAMAQFAAAVRALGPRLTDALVAIRRAAPDATLYILGYPDVMPRTDRALADCLGARAAGLAAAAVHASIEDLNQVVRSAATTAGAVFVDPAAAFAGHEMCTPTPYANPPNRPAAWAGAALHPNVLGHRALAAELVAAIAGQVGTTPPGGPAYPPGPTPPIAHPPRVSPPVPIPPPPVLWTRV